MSWQQAYQAALVAALWAIVAVQLWRSFARIEGTRLHIHFPGVGDHFSEIVLLGVIAGGVIWLAGNAIAADNAGEASAWTAVLMAIINAIKERWQQRSIDRMGQSLANSPPSEPPAEGAPR